MHAVSPYVVKSSWKWLALQICVIADTISCVVDLLLGRLKIQLSLLPIFRVATFQPPRFKWLLCAPWEALHVMLDICRSFVGWTVDMVSKRVGEALVTWLQQYHSYQLYPYPNLERTISFMCATNAHHSVANWLFVLHSPLPPSFLTSSTPSFPHPPPHLTPPTLPLLPPINLSLSSRGSFGKLGDRDHYYHLEPLNQQDTSVREWSHHGMCMSITIHKYSIHHSYRVVHTMVESLFTVTCCLAFTSALEVQTYIVKNFLVCLEKADFFLLDLHHANT